MSSGVNKAELSETFDQTEAFSAAWKDLISLLKAKPAGNLSDNRAEYNAE